MSPLNQESAATEIDWDLELDLGDGIQPEPAPSIQKPINPAVIKQSPANIGFLYCDIETIPDYDRQSQFGLPPLPVDRPVKLEHELMLPEECLSQTIAEIGTFFAQNNPCDSWLDKAYTVESTGDAKSKKSGRKGVFDLIEKSRDSRNAVENVRAAQQKKMSVTPEMCKIVAIGLASDDSETKSLVVGQSGVTEKDILVLFWDLAAKSEQIVGFNCLGFDLPTIFVRSILLGVPATRFIDISRYSRAVIDIYVRRFGGGFSSEPADVKTSKGMKSLCRQLGVPVPCEGVDGSQVEQLYRENPALLGQYVESDVTVSRKLHLLMSGYFC